MTQATHLPRPLGARKWARLIGVDAFLAPSIHARPHVGLQRLAQRLMARPASGFDPACVHTIPPPNATRRQILLTLHEIAEQTLPDDWLLVHFSCPGMILENATYLAPTDLDPELIPDTAIALHRVGELMSQAPAGMKLLWLDALALEGMETDARGFVRRALQELPPDIAVIAGYASHTPAGWEDATLTPMTRALVDGLAAADAPLSISGLAQKVHRAVEDAGEGVYVESRIPKDGLLIPPASAEDAQPSPPRLTPLVKVFPAAVRHPRDFFDRNEELAEVLQSLRMGVRRPIVIQGERGMGKTSLILRIAHALEETDDPPFRYFYLSSGQLESWEQFAREFLDGMHMALSVDASPAPWESLAGSRPLNFNRMIMLLRQMMAPLVRVQPEPRVVVIMDEIDKSGIRPLVLEKILSFIYFLLEKADDLPIFFLLTIIARDLPEPSSGSPMPVKMVRVSPFQPEALREMAAQIARNEALPFPMESLYPWIAAYSGGHPYIAKLLLAAVRKQVMHEAMGSATEWRPDRFLSRALSMEEARHFFEDIYRRFFDNNEKTIMIALAARPEAAMPVAEAALWPIAYRRALLNLEARGYVRREAGVIRFTIQLWPAWLRAWHEFELERLLYPPPAPEEQASPSASPHAIPQGLCIVLRTQRVYVDGREVSGLGRYPYRALVHLAEHAGEVVSRDALGRAIYQEDHYQGSNEPIDTIISRIRRAIGDQRPYRFIHTLRGRGYRLENVTLLDSWPPGERHV